MVQLLPIIAAAKEAAELIELGDQRAMAIDGPVGHFKYELSDKEWRKLYLALEKIREFGKEIDIETIT